MFVCFILFPPQDYLYLLYELIDEIATLPLGAITPGFDLIDRLRKIIHKILPGDAHRRANHKLYLRATSLHVQNKYQPLTTHDVDQGTSSSVRTRGPKLFEVGDRCWSLGDEVEISTYASNEELIEVSLTELRILFRYIQGVSTTKNTFIMF